MPPRRPRSTSNVSATNIPRAPTSSPQLKKQFALSIDSIYQNNITVLKRRDPTIVSILDQFSHVCLYHFNGKKWEKQGYEGSMFLVEHQQYPPYGMFILNRMGTGDYGRRIYPEDDMEVLGDYLMYRYYPDFTKKRLEMNLPYPLPPQYKLIFDQDFARDNSIAEDAQGSAQESRKDKKGNSVTLGLWMFTTDAREPLKDVMMRLHYYVKRGELYPEQFRYGPGRPPPQNLNRAHQASSQLYDTIPETESAQHLLQEQVLQSQPTMIPAGQSEVDRLFAKLQPPSVSSVSPSNTAQSQPRTAQSWFDALSGQNISTPPANTTISAAPAAAQTSGPSPSTSSRGLALLDTIFASVSQPTNGAPSRPPQNYPQSQVVTQQRTVRLPPHPEDIQIVSPKPQSSTLPQILNQNVISTLLGLGPDASGSRSSSTAPSSNSSRHSAANRYEGDNELSENEILSDRELTASIVTPALNGSHAPIPSYPQSSRISGSHSASVQGDVTPRAFNNGPIFTSPPPTTQRPGQSFLSTTTTTTTNFTSTSSGGADVITTSTTTSSVPLGNEGTSAAPKPRTLVPFSSDSDLWPYPRVPVNDNEQSGLDGDLVELDFSDTRALSDPNIFKEKQAKQQVKGERKKKSRKEKAEDQQREREAIENGWDDPSKGEVTIGGTTTFISNGHSTPSPGINTAVANGPVQQTNGTDSGPTQAPMRNGHNGATSSEEARLVLLSALGKYPMAPSRDLSRKQFVQEVLSLIYSDNSFVDKLHEEYTKLQ